jgi:predicted esterase
VQVVFSASLLLFALCGGCAPIESSASAVRPAAASGPARQLEESLVELPVPGHDPAVVSIPPAAARRRPLLVAAHGAWDRPEPHCALWRRVAGERAFILCPRGVRTIRRVPHSHAAYYYPDHFALEREVLAAVQALAARYPNELDPGGAVWAGFSQGAIHGALVIALHPQAFPRAALVEGGNGFFDEWSPYSARKYARAGGQRILFGCGSPYCVRSAARCAGYLEPTGVETRIVHAEGAGHSYGPTMEATLREDFAWLVADDPRWAP